MTEQKKFLKICQERHFFDNHNRVLLALSGGCDSMTLFNWLYNTRDVLDITLFCAHVNYGLRVEAEDEEVILKKRMQELGIPLEISHYQDTMNFTEERGRNFRYNFFKKIMEKNKCTALVTAHHKDDNVETLVMREIRGSRLFDLRGIAEKQSFAEGELIRPLLSFTKMELDAQDYFLDITNEEMDYFRNRVRNQMIPLFVKENPNFVEGVNQLTEEIDFATQFIREKIEELNLLKSKIELELFRKQSKAVQHFALQLYIERYAPDLKPKTAQFQEFLQIIQRSRQYNEKISDNYYFVKTATEFYLTNKEHPTTFLDICTENPNNSSFLQINFPIDKKYQVRSRQAGDNLYLHGLHKKVKKFFIDEKVDLKIRKSLLIALDSEIYAIPALGVVSDLSKILENATMKKTIWVKPVKEK